MKITNWSNSRLEYPVSSFQRPWNNQRVCWPPLLNPPLSIQTSEKTYRNLSQALRDMPRVSIYYRKLDDCGGTQFLSGHYTLFRTLFKPLFPMQSVDQGTLSPYLHFL